MDVRSYPEIISTEVESCPKQLTVSAVTETTAAPTSDRKGPRSRLNSGWWRDQIYRLEVMNSHGESTAQMLVWVSFYFHRNMCTKLQHPISDLENFSLTTPRINRLGVLRLIQVRQYVIPCQSQTFKPCFPCAVATLSFDACLGVSEWIDLLSSLPTGGISIFAETF